MVEPRQRRRKVPLRTAPTAVLPPPSLPVNTAGTLLQSGLGPLLAGSASTTANPFASDVRIPLCPEGTLCPRLNDRAHLQHFSHPLSATSASAPSSGGGGRVRQPAPALSLAACPMGAGCTRLDDEVHLRHFVHPTRQRGRTATKHVSGAAGQLPSALANRRRTATKAKRGATTKGGRKGDVRLVTFQLSSEPATTGRAPLHSSKAPSFFFKHNYASSLATMLATPMSAGDSVALNTQFRSASASQPPAFLVRGVRFPCGGEPEQAIFGLFTNKENAFDARKRVLDQFLVGVRGHWCARCGVALCCVVVCFSLLSCVLCVNSCAIVCV
jgi:hypothetical protein